MQKIKNTAPPFKIVYIAGNRTFVYTFHCDPRHPVVLPGDFNHPDICWRYNMAQHRPGNSCRPLKKTFWCRWWGSQWGKECCWARVLYLYTGRNWLKMWRLGSALVVVAKNGGSRVLGRGSKAVSRSRILNFQRANFSLFQALLRGIPWDRALVKKGIQEGLFKPQYLSHFL